MTILFIWAVFAAGSSGREYLQWRALSEFSSMQTCQKAAQQLGIDTDKFRCVIK